MLWLPRVFVGFLAAGAWPENSHAHPLDNTAVRNNSRPDAAEEKAHSAAVEWNNWSNIHFFCWTETGQYIFKATISSDHLAGKIYHLDMNDTRTGCKKLLSCS